MCSSMIVRYLSLVASKNTSSEYPLQTSLTQACSAINSLQSVLQMPAVQAGP